MNNKSQKLLQVNLWISKYLLYVIPIIIITAIWALSVPAGGNELEGILSILWEIVGWHFMIWFVLLVYFIISLFVWRTFREEILTKLTFTKERDEREEYISGRASKATFYSTLAALIMLFFISGLNVHVYKIPKKEAMGGKQNTVKIGYRFMFLKSVENENKALDKEDKNESLFHLNGIPFTKESILLFLILYHIASYHIFSRRRLKE